MRPARRRRGSGATTAHAAPAPAARAGRTPADRRHRRPTQAGDAASGTLTLAVAAAWGLPVLGGAVVAGPRAARGATLETGGQARRPQQVEQRHRCWRGPTQVGILGRRALLGWRGAAGLRGVAGSWNRSGITVPWRLGDVVLFCHRLALGANSGPFSSYRIPSPKRRRPR